MWWSPSKSFSTEPPVQQLGSLITNGRKIRDRIGYVERLCGKYDIDIGMEGEVRMEYSAEMIELTKKRNILITELELRMSSNQGLT